MFDEIQAMGTNFMEMWNMACVPYYDPQSWMEWN
jgi:hypothetical protein